MSEEVVVRYHFIGGETVDCEYTDKEMYYSSLNTFDLGGLLIFDKKVINTRNVPIQKLLKKE